MLLPAINHQEGLTMTKEELQLAIQEVMRNEMKSFYVEREQHYQDHCFIKDLRITRDRITSTATKTAVGSIIVAVLTLIVWGAATWVKGLFGK